MENWREKRSLLPIELQKILDEPLGMEYNEAVNVAILEVLSMTLSSLQEFRIVYSAASPSALIEREAAFVLRQKLLAALGADLTVQTEEEAPDGRRILLGALSGLSPAPTQYALEQRDDATLLLCAGSTAAYDALVEAAVQALTEGPLPAAPVIASCKDPSLGTPHGDLRILFHNIFGYDRKPTIHPQKRYALEATLYGEYAADILCLQEYDGGPRKYLGPRLTEHGFLEVPADQMGFPKNCSPIFYNPHRVTLLDHGFYPFRYKSPVNEMVCNNHDTKNLTWAAFEEQKTGKRFLVISVHFYYSPDASSDMTNRVESNKARMENAREMFEFLQDVIYTKNGGAFAGLPLLWGGDLNCSYGDKTKPSLLAAANGRIALDVLEDYGMKHVQKNALLFADTIGAYCGYPTYNAELDYYDSYGDLSKSLFAGSIDHAFVYGPGVTPLTFDILDSSFAKKTSDHAPIVVDYRLD